MNNTAKKPKDVSWADINATLDRATALSEKNEKWLEKFEKEMEELKAAVEKTNAAIFGVNSERAISMAKLEATVEKTNAAIFGVNSEVKGIARSNGMMAEDYFYASLDKSKTLGGIHFDIVEKNMRSAQKQKDGSKLSGQYDIVLINDNAICLIEVKYRVRVEDLLDVVDKDVGVFKTLFPQYADYQIYLAVGGMTFEDDAVNTAKKLGMGVLQLDGDAVVVYDKDLKVY